MTFDEFNALAIGDKVRNAQGHEAVVAATGEYGVRVQWGGTGPMFTLYRSGRIWVTMEAVPAPLNVSKGYTPSPGDNEDPVS